MRNDIDREEYYRVFIVGGLIRFFAAALAGALVAALGLALWSGVARAAPEAGAGSGDASGLFLRDLGNPDQLVPALTQSTDMSVEVSGVILRARVTQRFRNDSDRWMEGIYLFPLPDDAAVDGMTLLVGDRRIEGEIQEKKKAARTYARALAEGRQTGLLSQKRPNMFTTKVANIGPGEEISVEIRYQSLVRREGMQFDLTLPQVIVPRYTPLPDQLATTSGGDLEHLLLQQMKAEAELAQPMVPPSAEPLNQTSLRILLDAGMELAALDSPSHALNVLRIDEGRFRLSLQDGSLPADRDFRLTWRPKAGAAPRTAVFTEEYAGDTFMLTMVMPPEKTEGDTPPQPRDITFILDTSGSMEGASIQQARASLLRALSRLGSGDRFDIIQFNDTAQRLFGQSRRATPETVALAMGYVHGLEASGGTEMRPALEAALGDPVEDGYLRQILFMTDGAVSNEVALFTLVQARLGKARLFTVGLGPAPNGWFMRKAAEVGRGSFTRIADLNEAGARIDALLAQMEQPVLQDVAMRVAGGVDWEAFPGRIPDLYQGQPIIFSARVAGTPGGVTLTGDMADRGWGKKLTGADWRAAGGIAKLWARHKVEALEDLKYTGVPEDIIRDAVLDVALAHEILSPYTSFVAVDRTPVRPMEAGFDRENLPANTPEGLSFRAFNGPATAANLWTQLASGLVALLLALALFMRLRRGRAA